MGIAKNTLKKLDSPMANIGYEPVSSYSGPAYQKLDDDGVGLVAFTVILNERKSVTYKTLQLELRGFARFHNLNVSQDMDIRMDFLKMFVGWDNAYLSMAGKALYPQVAEAYLSDAWEEYVESEMDDPNAFWLLTGRPSDAIEKFFEHGGDFAIMMIDIPPIERPEIALIKNDVSPVFEEVGDYEGSYASDLTRWRDRISDDLAGIL